MHNRWVLYMPCNMHILMFHHIILLYILDTQLYAVLYCIGENIRVLVRAAHTYCMCRHIHLNFFGRTNVLFYLTSTRISNIYLSKVKCMYTIYILLQNTRYCICSAILGFIWMALCHFHLLTFIGREVEDIFCTAAVGAICCCYLLYYVHVM